MPAGRDGRRAKDEPTRGRGGGDYPFGCGTPDLRVGRTADGRGNPCRASARAPSLWAGPDTATPFARGTGPGSGFGESRFAAGEDRTPRTRRRTAGCVSGPPLRPLA